MSKSYLRHIQNTLKQAVILVCLAGGVLPLAASDDKATFFSNLYMRDGLPYNIMSCIAQDKYGFIWIGTGGGLARYDGYHFKVFKKTESAQSLPSNELNSLLTLDDHVWVGTWDGLCKVNVKTFEIERIDLGETRAIRTLSQGKGGIIWIGTGNSLIKYQVATNTYKVYNSQNSGLSHNTVRSIFEDRTGNLWVGTYDKLNKLPADEERFESFDLKGAFNPSLKNHLILDIKPHSSAMDSRLWIGTETGLYDLNTLDGSFRRVDDMDLEYSNEVIKCIYTDQNNNLWLGTDFGLNIYNPVTKKNVVHFHNPQFSYSIANNVIWQIFEDSSGVIWLMTSNGLSRINQNGSFYQYREISHTVEDQLIGNQVKSMLISSSGIYWLGTQHGVIRIDPTTNKQTIFDNSSPDGRKILVNNIFALEEDSRGKIWIGTSGGINVWDETRQKMYAFTTGEANGLHSNYIGNFTKTDDGSMWVSAWEGGLYKVEGHPGEPEGIRFIQTPGLESGSEKTVWGNGSLWVIEYDELYQVDPITLTKRRIPSFTEVSGKQMIYSIFFAKNGTLWAGTLNGLVEYNPDLDKSQLHRIITGNDVIVNSIIDDEEGNIWSTSEASIHKLVAKDQRIEIYPLDKDLPLKSFYYGCAARTSQGDILFGGDNGFIKFTPKNAKPNLFDPRIYITSIEINNKTLSINEAIDGVVLLDQDIAFTDELVLDYAQRSVTFQFSSLHYWQPDMNVYAYRMNGLDKEWNYVSGHKNFAVYSNLPWGEYTFEVKGTNNYGVQSTSRASLKLTVKPPIYLSSLFFVIYIVVISLIVIYALRFYSARVHLRNELRITRMEKAHTEEIDRTKEQFFTNISHELRTPISLILPPIHEVQKRGKLDPESSQLISLAEKNSIRLLRLVNQILDFNKLENEPLQIKVAPVELVGYCRDVFSLFADQAKRHRVDFTFSSTKEQALVWIDAEKIETVLFNLLSNAFKFTPELGIISMKLDIREAVSDFAEGAFQIVIEDTGIGIPREDRQRIFERFYQAESGKRMDSSSGIGLTLASEYVELHHGTINVESEEGHGTSFTILLPLGKSHFPIDSIRDGHQEISLKATRSLYAYQEGAKPYHLDLESDHPLVLIVEDNDDIIEFIRNSLGHKYNFVVASNGEEGLTKAGNFMPEVIISDIMMPIMDGLSLCEKIKENPKTSHIMVILLTAKSMASHRLDGIRRGADVYLTKPFEIDLLDAHLTNLLHRKEELTSFFRSELISKSPTTEAKDNQDNKFVKKVMDIIEANVDATDFTVEHISHEMGMSTTHLYRKLKALTSHSPKDIIRKYRLKKASLLLQNNEGNVSETMYKVGFSSLSYFSRCFREEYGLTPKDYQQKMARQDVGLPGGIG